MLGKWITYEVKENLHLTRKTISKTANTSVLTVIVYHYIIHLIKLFLHLHNNTRKQSVKTANTSVLSDCVSFEIIEVMTCNNLQNFTKFSRTSIHPHSGRIVGL